MGEEKEDKFASLMKLCKPTASQESKLRTCPMARESEIFADSNADPVSSSSAPTSSEPTGIVMVSLPESSSSIDLSTGHDDELEFHTPPEQRFSSSEDQPVDCAVGEPTAVDIGCTGGGVGTDDSGEGNSGSGFVELKKNSVPDGGSTGNSVMKKARVSEDLDLELDGENEFVGKNESILIEISSDSESEEFDEKTERTNMAVDSPMKKSMDNGGVAEKVEVPENGESNGGSKNGDVQMDGLDEIFGENSKNCKSGKVSESDAVKVTGGEKAHKNDDGKGRPDSAKNAEEIEKFKYVPSAAVVGRRGKDRVGGAGVSVGGKRELPLPMKKSMDNGGVAEKGEVPENGESNGGSKNGDVQMDGLDEIFGKNSKNCKSGKVSESDAVKVTGGEKAHKNDDGKGRPDSAKNAEEIEKFKYVPSAAVVGRRGKDRVGGAGVSVGGKRELPLSMKGKERNARTKNGLLMDLLEVLKVKKVGVGDSEEDVDFLEMAKRRGLTFPKPRWWPPEGFEE